MDNKRPYGSKLFEKAPLDREAMGMYFRKIASSPRFTKAIETGELQRPKRNRNRVFDDLMEASWNEYLILSGRGGSKISSEKLGLARRVFEIFSDMEEIDFRIIDESKMLGGFKYNDRFFTVGTTKHRGEVECPAELVMPTKPKVYIQAVVDDLIEDYDVVLVKNNKVTLKDEEGTFFSVVVTQKRKPLF